LAEVLLRPFTERDPEEKLRLFLRHSFAIAALQSGVPINFVRKWLGHARLSTTEIYANAVGEEGQTIASRFWDTF
ncbi:MAG: tyrosine-type recombinase/integrase, partial [Magnetococcales bacterium]|nr:tyrosine-type recombinase/integrase [Magnetococcales bacterium]